MKGWIIDAQLGDDGNTMDVWLFVKGIGVQRLVVPWCASIHIHSSKLRLQNLANWLQYPGLAHGLPLVRCALFVVDYHLISMKCMMC